MLSVHMKKKLSHYTLDVTFQVGNEIVVLYGPSGAGKTTILNAIAGLTKVHDGDIRLNNRILLHKGKSIIPVQDRNVGYFFQDYALFPHKTIWENIAYGMKQERFAKDLIRKLGIGHLLEQYPHEISGGEKQRAALIRALATEPELLLLDEPFSALDEKTKEMSYEQLLAIHSESKIPILLVTHNKTERELLADRVLYIENGRILREEKNDLKNLTEIID